MLPRPTGLVTLLTDYGTRDPYVGIVRGTVLRHNPRAVLVDLLHDVPPQDVESGAFFLHGAVGNFPVGAVHVAVVDPGVGTERRLLAMAAHECYWLAPDNGLLSHVIAADPAADVRQLDLDHLNLRATSRTFHGRDILAPVAGWLSGGRYGFTALGPRAVDVVRLQPLLGGSARVVHIDSFGNLITNVPAAALGAIKAVRIAGRELPILATYASAAPGALLALVGSYGWLEIAQNLGDAARTLGVARGVSVDLVPLN